MSENSEAELKSLDQTSVTTELFDKDLTDKNADEMSNMTKDKVETANEVTAIATYQPTNLPIDKNTYEMSNVTEVKVETANDVTISTNQPTNLPTDKNVDEMSNVTEDSVEITDDVATITTNQPTDLSTDKNVDKMSNVTEDRVEIANDVATIATNHPTNFPIKNLFKDTRQIPDSTTAVKHEGVVEDKQSNSSLPAVQETNTVREILNTESPSLINEKHIGASKIAEEVNKETSKDEYAAHVTYTEDGTAIYTDPKTNCKYKWCTKENKWTASDVNTGLTDVYENEHYKWCSVTQKWLPKQTQVTETEHYKWDADKNQWIAKIKETKSTEPTNSSEIVYDIDENGQRTYTDKDGVLFFWDVEKNAWFPKIDDDFMARYQMSYGFIDNTSESEQQKHDLEVAAEKEKENELARLVEEAKASEEVTKQGLKRKQPQDPPKWFEIDQAHNTKVYVSNLPLDITLEEFADVMGKCGMIMRDPQTQKFKLKLYTESDGQIKGDGLCDYIKVESVDLALKILDECDLRGQKMRVQRAQFQMRGEYNPALKPKRKKKDKEKLAKIKEKLFDWRPEKMRGERSKHEKTVIIKNLFEPDLFEKEVQLILDYQNDLREECSKCGTVRKVVIYDRHSEGVAQVNMSAPEEADLVIQMMHGRFFGKRKLTAEHWDGKTKYKIEETEEDVKKRLNKWDQYLEAEENKKPDLPEKPAEEKPDLLTDNQNDEKVLAEVEN